MEYSIELGGIADISGNISKNGQGIINSMLQIAADLGLKLNAKKTRIERHANGRRGGNRYVRYVLVAPRGVNKDEWLAKAKKLETLVKEFLIAKDL